MTPAYWSTKDLCKRYGRSARTIFRWMNRKDHPFPAAKYKPARCNNLWAIDEVGSFEIPSDIRSERLPGLHKTFYAAISKASSRGEQLAARLTNSIVKMQENGVSESFLKTIYLEAMVYSKKDIRKRVG